MTIQESIDDILARLKHALLQRERAAREWERQSNQWEQRWRDVTKERDELLLLVGAETPIAALTLAQSWQAEKAHYMGKIEQLTQALDEQAQQVGQLVYEASNPVHDHWNDWVARLKVVAGALEARVSSHNDNQDTSAVEETQEPGGALAAAARAVLDTQLAYTAATVLVSRDAFEALRRLVGDGA